MKAFSRILLAFFGLGILADSATAQYISTPTPNSEREFVGFASSIQSPNQDQEDENDITYEEDKMYFNCTNWEWERVIEVFTERTGLALQPLSDYPPGTVTIYENEPYTIMEGLDKLNMNLAIKGYTLVRKGNQLFLTEIRDLTPQMIETVDPEDLEKRGKYEIMRVTFDLSELDADELERSISARISNRSNRSELLYVPLIEQITVQETGEVLREIKSWIDVAREEAQKKAPGRRKYILQHFPPDQVLTLARPLIGLEENQNSMEFEDGTKLTLVYDDLDNYIMVNSSNEKIDEIFKIFEELDIAAPTVDTGSIAAKSLEKHAVSGDRDLAMQIMQSFFQGRDVMLDQDAQTGDIMLFGTKKDHDDARAYLDIANGDGSRGLKSIPLKYKTQTEMIAMLLPLLGITESADGTLTGNGPKIVPVTDTDALFVMGTPQEVIKVSRMIEELDIQSSTATAGVPTNTRYIPMSLSEAMRVTNDDLEDIFRITGRKNKLLIVKPEDRKTPRRNLLTDDEIDELERSFEESLPGNSNSADEQKSDRDDQSSYESIDMSRYRFVSTGNQEDDDQVGEASDEEKNEQDDYYQLPDVPESIPGSPITLKIVDGGIVVASDDLSALDDMVDLINQLMAETSEEDIPAVFYLKHRRPDVVKALLDQYIGLSSGSSGGGGNNLIQNVASNAFGPAGDIFGGLLGGGLGGGTSTGGGYVLEGDVSTFADVKLNYILVKGHTLNDYDVIAMHIELLDQPETPVDLDLVGEMRRIPIFHREPQEIYDFVVAALPEYIETGDGGGGNGGGGNEQQMMQQMMRALGGGGNGGGQSIDTEAEKPKATVSVDNVRPALVVTGPEYIFKKIEAMVLVNDTKEPIANQKSQLIDLSGVDPALAAQFLETVYPGKLTVIQGEAGEASPASGNGGNTPDSQGEQQRAQTQAAMQQMFRNAMQQRGGGRGGQGFGGRGGQGGGRGGGGRGGGGGGGGRGGR